MVFALPQTLVKTLAKNLVKNLVKNLAKNRGGRLMTEGAGYSFLLKVHVSVWYLVFWDFCRLFSSMFLGFSGLEELYTVFSRPPQ